jgi:hypothetical protein
MRARVSLLVCLVLAVGAMALPASASAQTQEGLVNVSVTNNTIQVPIGVAANVCDVDVNVLVQNVRDTGQSTCDAFGTAIATDGGGGGGPGANQQGLVNVDISNNTIQVPIGLAANICGVSVNVLSQDIVNDAVTCTARGFGRARA